jgi:hypothetical protein
MFKRFDHLIIVTYGVTGVNDKDRLCGFELGPVGDTQKVVDIFKKPNEN